MLLRMIAAASLALLSSHALAFEASKAARYPSPDMYRPNVDGIIFRGNNSVGPIDGTSATATGAGASQFLKDALAFAGGNTPTISTLKAIPTAPLVPGVVVSVSGYYSAADGGGGALTWSPTSTAAEDGCSVFMPASGVGRWLRDVAKAGVVNVKQCGAKVDNTNDDTAAIQATFNLCKGRGDEGKPLCSVRLGAGISRHTGLVIDRALSVTGDPRGSTLFAVAGITKPGLTVSCAYDTVNYYGASGAPPCKISLSHMIVRHENRTDVPGRNVAHAIKLQNAATNPVSAVFDMNDVEIFQAPGDGFNTAGFNGIGYLNKLYISSSYRDNLSLTSAYDWRVSNIDLIYAGQDNMLTAGVAGLKAIGVHSYSATRNGITIFGDVGSPGVNYWYGVEADSNGQSAISYDERDPYAVTMFSGGNVAQNSQSQAGNYPDVAIQPNANSQLRLTDGFRFNVTNGNFAIAFYGSAKVYARDAIFQGGAPTVANKFSNSPGSVIGLGAPDAFPYGLNASGTASYAPIISTANPGSGIGSSVEWPGGNSIFTGFDGSNNRPKIQARTGGSPGNVGGTPLDMGVQPEGGGFGVGTTNPGAKLDVAGTMRGQFLSLSAAPTASNIPTSYWTVVKRTDDASVKVCANDNGTIKCAAMQ